VLKAAVSEWFGSIPGKSASAAGPKRTSVGP
jgi:hypothetical protein